MSDLENLSTVSGADLTVEQIKGILSQIDLDITNLVRDGKLSALRYSVGGRGRGGQRTDRAANLKALLDARTHYERLLASQPAWEASQASCGIE